MMDTLSQRHLQVHIPVVAWLMIVGHAIFLCAGTFVLALLAGIGLAVREDPATPILLTVGALVAIFLAVLALPGLVAGVGLLLRQGWARYLAIVVAILGLINFPLGTLIGVYSIWVLFQDDATNYFAPQPKSG
jgi:hypothetical protein